MAPSISKIKFRLISLAVSEEKIFIEIVDADAADNDAGRRTTTIAYGLPAGKLKISYLWNSGLEWINLFSIAPINELFPL